MKKTILTLALTGITAMLLLAGSCMIANAGGPTAIPYPYGDTINTDTYSFTAASTGHIYAYYSGGDGLFDNEVGLLVGTATDPLSVSYGLLNHSSNIGLSFDMGLVNAGDKLTFVMRSFDGNIERYFYSDPSMNILYDDSGYTGLNHVYSTSYTESPSFPGVPTGTYVAFEDFNFPAPWYNYGDISFVFTQQAPRAVPEPATLLGFGLPILMIGLGKLRGMRN